MRKSMKLNFRLLIDNSNCILCLNNQIATYKTKIMAGFTIITVFTMNLHVEEDKRKEISKLKMKTKRGKGYML